MGAVVLAHGPPLALAQVRSPELPALLAACVFGESHPLGRSGVALGSRLDRHAHDSVLILDQHGSPPLKGGREKSRLVRTILVTSAFLLLPRFDRARVGRTVSVNTLGDDHDVATVVSIVVIEIRDESHLHS